MSIRFLIVIAVFIALALRCAPARAYPENYASAKLGAGVLTQAKIWGDKNPNDILSDGPISKGEFAFADVNQRHVFVIDLGTRRVFDRVEFGSDNEGGHRSPKQLTIEVSSKGPDGPFKTALVKSPIAWFQVLRLPRQNARWIRFDLGEGPAGPVVSRIRIYKGYEHPKLSEVTKLLHARIKPGLPGLEKFYAAADAGDWKNACKALRAYYAQKQPPEGPPNPKADLKRATDYAEGKLDYAGISRVEKVPIDWAYQKNTDWYEHKNFLNRGSRLGASADAYYNTGDKKWAKEFQTVFYDWLEANPKPEVMSRADYPCWRTLDSAARAGWLYTRFKVITASKGISDELWANWFYSIWEHADYLKNDTFDGGNWLATVSGAVMAIALEYPEFADQKTWLEFGKLSFETNVMRDVHPDGKEMEDAPGYVSMAYRGMLGTLESLDKAGIEVSPESKERLSRTQDFLAAVTQPNGLTPAIGDDGGGAPWALPAAYDYFKRDYIKYVLSQGKEGNPPPFTSINFPDGGWSIMRSSYDEKPYENARHLAFKSSSASHGHLDMLNITAYGYGRELVIDPGIRSYEAADVERYLHTAYHNTICVDGKSQSRGGGKTEKWMSNEKFDVVIGSHVGYKGLTVRRTVVFVKPEYWIVHDDVIGEGEHTYDQNWHLPEDAGPVEDPAKKAVHTTFPDGGNLLMVPADPETLTSGPIDFMIAKKRMESDGNVPSKGWRYRKTGPAPRSFDVVLYPYSGAQVPQVSVERYDVEGARQHEATSLEIKIGDRIDTFLFSPPGPRDMKVTMPGGRLQECTNSQFGGLLGR
ncbi:MAG: alginate lyase family protein [Armatimonadota bacterium]|nr:alginate lyase family protein [Armatimonadota bacterium]